MNIFRIVSAVCVLSASALCATSLVAVARQGNESPDRRVTFAKDVAPILQRACQDCHRPGTAAPMSLVTYDEARPWARAIRSRVLRREMPPWHIDRTIGIQKFKDDRSLSDEEIDTIVSWVDSGAAMGNPADMPPPRKFDDPDRWQIGTPDLIVSLPTERVIPASGPDWFGDVIVDTGITERRYIKAVEIKPSKKAVKAVHHINLFVLQGDPDDSEGAFIHTYEPGANADVYPPDYGFLLQPGSRFRFGIHYHSYGEATTDRAVVGIVFHPKGYTPRYEAIVRSIPAGFESGDLLPPTRFILKKPVDLDIPAGASDVRHDGYERLAKPARILSFQPHMHERGKALCLEAILPNGKIELLNCVDRYDFRWQVNYRYVDDVAPLLPTGTVLHVTSWHDNSASTRNPDSKNWIGWGQRSIDEMAIAVVKIVTLSEEQFRAQTNERAKARSPKGRDKSR